jgi:hypothetical protein
MRGGNLMSINSINSIGIGTDSSNKKVKNKNDTDFFDILNSSVNQTENDLDSIFETASKKYNIPVNLLKAVAKTESNFNSNATSNRGAMGIMQLMPGTAESLGINDAYDPQQNIMGGAKYLSQMLDEFDGDAKLAVAAYNAGAGNIRKYGGIPPFEETQNYVNKVLGYCGDDISANLASANGYTSNDSNEFSLDKIRDYYEASIAKLALMNISNVKMSDVNGNESSII